MSGRKLRVIFVLENLCGGGAERTTLNLMRNLDRDRFEPVLFLLTKSGVYFGEVPKDIKVVFGSESLSYSRYLMPHYLSKLVREARKSDIVVGAMEFRTTYIAYVAGLLARKPVIGWVRTTTDKFINDWRNSHNSDVLGFANSKVKFVYPRLRYVVCVSEAVAESVKRIASVKPKRLQVRYNPYEIDSFIEKGQEDLPDSYSDVLNKPTIIAVGRMTNEKGFDILIKAHAQVLKKGIQHNLLIVGSGVTKELEDLALSLNVDDSVFMAGYMSNPYPLIRNATALVLSSRYEGLSGVIIEAMALGTPVVSTACEGSTEALSAGRYGVLVQPDDVESLAEGIARILTDTDLRDELAASGPDRARFFSPENTVPQWEQLLIEATQTVICNKV